MRMGKKQCRVLLKMQQLALVKLNVANDANDANVAYLKNQPKKKPKFLECGTAS